MSGKDLQTMAWKFVKKKNLLNFRDANLSSELHNREFSEVFEVEKIIRTSFDLFKCTTCEKTFDSDASQKHHFKSDWHIYNLNRKLKNKAIVSEEEFVEAKMLLCNSQDDSVSISSSSEEEVLEADDAIEDQSPSGMIKIVPLGHDMTKKGEWYAYKNVLLDSLGLFDRNCLDGEKFWTILLYSAGHFSAAVFKLDLKKTGNESLIVSKSFHRYVVRRKQGGAQSAKDNSGKKAKSAGATMRRYNEARLNEEVGDLIKSWKEYVNNSSRVFFSVPVRNRSIIFGENLIPKESPCLRRIPFSTGRPTKQEIISIFDRLSQAFLFEKLEGKETRDTFAGPVIINDIEEQAVLPPPSFLPAVEEVFQVSPACEKVIELIRRYYELDEAVILDQLGGLSSADLIELRVWRDEEGLTLLHLAAQFDLDKVIEMLAELRFNVEARDHKGRTSYQLCSSKPCRDAFRVFRGKEPDLWDYNKAGIPPAITTESIQQQKEALKVKKKLKKEKEKSKKAGEKSQETVSEPLRSNHICTNCGTSMSNLPTSDWFFRLDFIYCSMECVNAHRRTLMAEAALSRLKK